MNTPKQEQSPHASQNRDEQTQAAIRTEQQRKTARSIHAQVCALQDRPPAGTDYVASVERERDELRAQLDAFRAEPSMLRATLEDVRRERDTLRAQLEGLQSYAVKLDDWNDELQKQVTTLIAACKGVASHNAALKDAYKLSPSLMRQVETAIAAAEREQSDRSVESEVRR